MNSPTSFSNYSRPDFPAEKKKFPETFQQLYCEKIEENLSRPAFFKLITQKSLLTNEESDEISDTKNSMSKKPKLSKSNFSKYLKTFFLFTLVSPS